MNTQRRYGERVWIRGLAAVGVSAICGLSGGVEASPPLETFPIPAYSFDLESPGSDGVGADAILTHDTTNPNTTFPGPGLGLGRLYDDLDGLSTANPGVVATQTFVLLFSVDRDSVGAVLPDPALVQMGVPFNVADQVDRGHAAGDLYMSTLLFTRAGVFSDGSRPRQANNTLVINNFDEGGRDFGANPPTSARDNAQGAPQDNVDATSAITTNGTTNGSSGTRPERDRRRVPPLYYSVASGSSSLSCTPDPCLPGNSPADIFVDGDPRLADTEQVYATAQELGLLPPPPPPDHGDDIDGLIVFDLNTNAVFDPGDQVLFTLARDSPTLYPLNASPADVFSVTYGGSIQLFASAYSLGLAFQDNIDAADFLFCDDGLDCARRFGIRAVCGDWDNDGDVDLLDHAGFVTCLSGPAQAADFVPPGELCRFVFDDDHDLDVDLADFRIFQAVFTGPLLIAGHAR